MKMVKLKAKGPVEFTRRTKTFHESGRMSYEMKTYRFSLENDCRLAIPEEVWNDLSGAFLDQKTGMRYQDYLTPI